MATLNDVQSLISAEFDQSGSVINPFSGEYERRRRLVNIAERMWREFNSGRWSVLRTTASLILTIGQPYVTLPSDYIIGREDFDHNNQLLKIGSTDYKKITPNQRYQFDPAEPLVWFSGNEAIGYRLNLQPTPSEAVSFDFPYFSKNTAIDENNIEKEFMTLPSDKTKIPDPTFLSDYALGRLFRVDDEPAKGGQYTQESLTSRLVLMASQNAQIQGLNIPNAADDVSLEPIGGYFQL